MSKTPEKMMQELAKRIKFLRLNRHWTREDLANAANVNIYSLKRFERTGDISLARLLALCEALGVLHEFDHILKSRERIKIEDWKMSMRMVRQRGRRRSSTTNTPSPVVSEPV